MSSINTAADYIKYPPIAISYNRASALYNPYASNLHFPLVISLSLFVIAFYKMARWATRNRENKNTEWFYTLRIGKGEKNSARGKTK